MKSSGSKIFFLFMTKNEVTMQRKLSAVAIPAMVLIESGHPYM